MNCAFSSGKERRHVARAAIAACALSWSGRRTTFVSRVAAWMRCHQGERMRSSLSDRRISGENWSATLGKYACGCSRGTGTSQVTVLVTNPRSGHMTVI
ncbi:hypothetical protein BJX64DRAFT_267273 [Aspergillus heterothallicus]